MDEIDVFRQKENLTTWCSYVKHILSFTRFRITCILHSLGYCSGLFSDLSSVNQLVPYLEMGSGFVPLACPAASTFGSDPSRPSRGKASFLTGIR